MVPWQMMIFCKTMIFGKSDIDRLVVACEQVVIAESATMARVVAADKAGIES